MCDPQQKTRRLEWRAPGKDASRSSAAARCRSRPAAALGPHRGQGADVAGRRDRVGEARQFRRAERAGARRRLSRASSAPRAPALRPPAASTRHRPACRPGFSRSAARTSRRSCVSVSRPTSSSSFSQAMSGWRRKRAGARAGRVEQDGVEGGVGDPFAGIGRDQLGRQAGAGEVLAHPHHAAGRDVDGGDLGAGGGELQGLAARCGAEIGDAACPTMSPSRRAGSVAAASCTHHAPSAKPGNSVTLPPPSRRIVPVGSTSPSRRPAQKSALERGVRSSGASIRWAAAMARVASSP